MVSIETLLSWQPATLSTAADSLTNDRRTLLDLQDEILDANPAGKSWYGEAASAAGEAHRALRDRLNDQVAEISPVIEALDNAYTRINSAQERVRSSRDAIQALGWTLTVTASTVRADPPAGSTAEETEGDQATVDSHVTTISEGLSDAETADADLTAVLQSANNNQYDGGSGSLADASLPPEARYLSDRELAEWLLEDPENRNTYVDGLTVTQQQALGTVLGENLDEIGGMSPDLYYDDGDFPDSERIDQLTEQLEFFGTNPVVATSLLERLGPEGLAGVSQTLLAERPGSGQLYSPDTIGGAQNALGAVLAAGTNGVDDTPGGSASNVSRDWVDQLVESGEQRYRITDDNFHPYDPYGYQLLAPLLRAEGHSTYLLTSVGEAMETFEREHIEREGVTPWEEYMGYGASQIDYTDGPAEVVGEWGEDGWYWSRPTGQDPFGGLFEGMEHNPEAGREFLHGANGENLDRVDYYLSERDWPQHTDSAAGWPTSQRYFGDALVAATTQDATEASPQILERAVAVAYADATGENPTELIPSLRRDFAEMFSAYAPDVYEAYSGDSHPDASWLPGGRDPNLAADLDRTQLDQLIGQIGADDQEGVSVHAGDILTQGMSNYASLGYDHYLGYYSDEANRDDWPPDVQNMTFEERWMAAAEQANPVVNQPFGNILETLGGSYAEQATAAGAASDAEHNAGNNGYWNEAGYVFDYVVGEATGKVPFVGGLIEDAVTAGSGAVVDGQTSAGDIDTSAQVEAQINETLADREGHATQVAEAAVYRNLPDEYLDPVFFAEDGSRIPMSQWGEEQVTAWSEARTEPGITGTGARWSDDLRERISR
ncbi:hypothetical protein RDV89_10425 [Nocardioides zeae]|uniref:WXG100 family type VII secretion target n=1 Tax=Nocardioides imazamoxiresistens TaxID=3231893 RepID=A0ABU3PW68_9ACTN|nr:hypothetical protein [Nocardioides zeae]MDT9593482.1 hypothetical protein [Nocardioides zeae]